MPGCQIYLDHAATSPIEEELAQKLCSYLMEFPCNSETVYEWGLQSKRALEQAREDIKNMLKWKEELVFTSGGTEGNNLALKALKTKKPGVLWVTQTGHPSIVNPSKALSEEGWELVELPIWASGALDLAKCEDLPTPDLVSVEWVNSEAGFIQPIEALASMVKKKNPKAKVVVDAVQGIGKLNLPSWDGIDAVVFSGHKFGAPIGVGAVAFRPPGQQNPLQLGGGQESGWRSGTVALANILCLRDALKKALERSVKAEAFYEHDLFHKVEGQAYTPYLALIKTPPVDGEVLLHQLEASGIALGLGSACQASRKKPSKTLELMGFKGSEARQTLRMSWTPSTPHEVLGQTMETLQKLYQESKRYFK